MRSRRSRENLETLLRRQIKAIATVLRPATMRTYKIGLDKFLGYLQGTFPQVQRLSQLQRDPHLLGWFCALCEQTPPLANGSRQNYLVCLQRLFRDLARNGHSQHLAKLITYEDIPKRPHCLPRALTPEDDQRLQQELQRMDNLDSHTLLLIRATGIRIGECINLAQDCLRPLGNDQWALHVPLGKLYTERLVPMDESARQSIARILTLRTQVRLRPESTARLLPRRGGGEFPLGHLLRKTLRRAAERAGCSQRVSPHRLRHTFATEMLRLGVSLPALMQLLGHKNIQMTMRYLLVTQQDLQREFHLASKNRHFSIPQLPLPALSLPPTSDLPAIRQSLVATRNLIEMYRRQLADESTRRKLQHLEKRLFTIAAEFEKLQSSKE